MKAIKKVGIGLFAVLIFLLFALRQMQYSKAKDSTKQGLPLNNDSVSGGRLVNPKKFTFGELSPNLKLLSDVVKTNDFRLKGESKFVNGQASVTLDWDHVSGTSDGYAVQRTTNSTITDNDSFWEITPTNYGKHVKILNVHPLGGNYLRGWMNQDNGSGQPVSMNLIDITEVSLPDFNANPQRYLKDVDGNYQYDGIYFGSADSNGGVIPGINDLTAFSQSVVATFANTGRSLIFGHDTVYQDGSTGHEYFKKFAPKLGIRLYADIINEGGSASEVSPRMGTNVVNFSTNGVLNQYPYVLDPTKSYRISHSHSLSQFFDNQGGAIRWMQFNPSGSPTLPARGSQNVHHAWDRNGNLIGDDNWYLVTKNNYAMIQTGHSNGACTPDEAKIIANMTYYTSTLNTTTDGEDYTVKDSAAPDSPVASLNRTISTQLSLNINAQDKGTDYYYRVKAKSDISAKYSDVIKTTVTSGLKGYIYTVDNNPIGTPSVTRNPSNGEVTNINLNPTSSTDPQAILHLPLPVSYGKYVHIVAVDNANNISAVSNIRVDDFKWWDIDSITKVLTIYPHELNGSLDTVGQSVWPWYGQAMDVTKVVISPGVTARGSLHNLFADLINATSIEGIESLNTANVTDMNAMFAHCQSLTSLDVSHFNTANVTDMNSMFNYCTGLTSLDVGNFVTNQVISMRGMFQACVSITELDLSNFNTDLVRDFSFMFNEMHKLNKLDVTSFNTINATDMTSMFAHLRELPILNLSSFNTSNVTVMTSIFESNPKLWQLRFGANTKLASDNGLINPRVRSEIVDSGVTYYATAPQWREVSGGTVHEPAGNEKSATQIATESQTRTDTRTYVWDQVGKQTLSVTSSNIDFGIHGGYLRNIEYISAPQNLNMTDTRNARYGKQWHIEAAVTRPFKNTADPLKVIGGNPLYYHDSTSGATTNLTPVSQTLYTGTANRGYQDIISHPWTLSFKARPSDIPVAGIYGATITFTLVNATP